MYTTSIALSQSLLSRPLIRSSVAAPATTRRLMLDVGRVMSIYAIVWVHSVRSPELVASKALGRFGVPFFTILAILMAWQSARRGSTTLTHYTLSRIRRLYFPFLAWTAIYIAMRAGRAHFFPDLPNVNISLAQALVVGGHVHLWFLPFIMTVTIGTFVVATLVSVDSVAKWVLVLTLIPLGLYFALTSSPSDPRVIDLWWCAIPAACWGLAIVIAYRLGIAPLFETWWLPLLGLAGLLLATLHLWHAYRDVLCKNLGGVAFFCFAMAPWQNKLIESISKLAPLTYGIYLSHILFIKSTRSTMDHFEVPWTPGADMCVFLLAASGGTLLSWLLSRHPATRWMIG